MFLFQKGKIRGKKWIGIKQDWKPAGQTLNPVFPCLAHREKAVIRCELQIAWEATSSWHCCLHPLWPPSPVSSLPAGFLRRHSTAFLWFPSFLWVMQHFQFHSHSFPSPLPSLVQTIWLLSPSSGVTLEASLAHNFCTVHPSKITTMQMTSVSAYMIAETFECQDGWALWTESKAALHMPFTA